MKTLDEIMVDCQPLITEMRRQFLEASPSTTMGNIVAVKGKKYIRIMRGSSSHPDETPFLIEGFIDTEGNILFGAYDGPYKYASANRGNIYNDDKGFGALSGAGCLRYL